MVPSLCKVKALGGEQSSLFSKCSAIRAKVSQPFITGVGNVKCFFDRVEELKVANFSQGEIDGILRSFVLRHRDRWDIVQQPFRNRDWYPWRYRRQLSLMTRPIVDLGDGAVAYAPGFCDDSFRHTVMECFNGAFNTGYFDSKKMKKYIGAINAHRGLEFNKAVGNFFKCEWLACSYRSGDHGIWSSAR